MDSNSITAAIQAKNADILFGLWKEDHAGTLTTFVEFMSTPSPARSIFLRKVANNTSAEWIGEVVAPTIAL